MTLANTKQCRNTPWFAKAGAACSIVPISRFVGPNIFALKGGGYGCLFSLTGIDEEGLTDLELDSRMRSIEGSLRGLPEGSCLYQYTRIMSGFRLPREAKYANPATEVFATDRLTFLEKSAAFRRIDLHWCLTLEPSKVQAFERKPNENALDTSRMLADLEKTAVILESHLGSSLGLKLLGKAEAFQFFSYLFNLEEWSEKNQLRSDAGVDRQIVNSTVAWHSDHLQVGKRHVQMFSLKTTPEASRPCLFSGFFSLDCDSVLCSSWRVKSASAARSEIDAQEKFISFFKVGVLTRVMSGRDTASLETGAGAKAANSNVDDLSEVIRALDKKAQGEFSLRLLLAGRSAEQLRNTVPAVHRIFVDARAQVMEETLGNLSAFYAMFPGNHKFNVFPLWLAEDHHARLSSVFAPHTVVAEAAFIHTDVEPLSAALIDLNAIHHKGASVGFASARSKWHFLYLRPEPQGHNSFLPTLPGRFIFAADLTDHYRLRPRSNQHRTPELRGVTASYLFFRTGCRDSVGRSCTPRLSPAATRLPPPSTAGLFLPATPPLKVGVRSARSKEDKPR
jgi:type IV secretion system protein VirB4